MSEHGIESDDLEPERYELRERPSYRFELDRRQFGGVLGAGLLITSLVARNLGALPARQARRSPPRIAERLHIGEDGVVTVMSGKVDVGQGARTQLAMAAACELRVPLERVRLILADSAVVPDDGGTYGSRTTPSTVPRVRAACAAVRELLLETAAAAWSVEPGILSFEGGRVVGSSPGRTFGYETLASAAHRDALDREIGPDVVLTPVAEWTVLGAPAPRIGGAEIVTGAHRYPSDIRRPGMLYGAVLRPPVFGATLDAIDLEPVREIEGVVAVADGDFAGVAARTSHDARRALDVLREHARWTEPERQVSSEDLFAHLEEHAGEGRSRSGRGRTRGRGSYAEALAAADQTLSQTYRVAYIQHAPMEPRAAVAEWEDGQLSVWTGTQNPGRVRQELARTFRIGEDAVRLVVPDTGGGFGGKHTAEVAVEAARLARAADRPVSLTWTREEEFTFAYFRPAGVITITAGLDRDGRLIAWEQINVNSGSSALGSPYDVPNERPVFRPSEAPLRQGSYRGLAATANTFARESFMDEVAVHLEQDPLELRLGLLGDLRLRAVLESAASRFDWSRRREETAADPTRGVGLACGTEKGSYVAACVELSVASDSGHYRVIEVCEAFECGAIQNPGNLRAQVEGAIIQGMGGALWEVIRFAGGRISNPRFGQYRVPRFEDLPKIVTVLLDRPDLPSAGAGETPIIAVAPAIANALFAATGERLRSLPIQNERYRPGSREK